MPRALLTKPAVLVARRWQELTVVARELQAANGIQARVPACAAGAHIRVGWQPGASSKLLTYSLAALPRRSHILGRVIASMRANYAPP